MMSDSDDFLAKLIETEALNAAAQLERSQATGNKVKHAVHDARVLCKRLRAIAPLLPDPRMRHLIRARAAKVSAALTNARDSAVQADCVEQPVFARLKKRHRKQIAKAQRRVMRKLDTERGLLPVARNLRKLAGLSGQMRKTRVGELLAVGLTDSYRSARSAMPKASWSELASAPHWHRWRKRCKQLQYQLDWHDDNVDGELRELRADLEQLTETLGQFQDLQVTLGGLSDKARRRVVADADLHALCLQVEALEVGRRLFAQKPKTFRRRLLPSDS